MPMEKTFNADEAEARISKLWLDQKVGRAGANAKEGKPAFSIMIPPPNVTGSLHMGHAFNNTLQDVLVRWHRMRGFDTLWQPGTDHAGIATQMVVERELAKEGKRRDEFSRPDFLGLVWEQKKKSRSNIIGQLQRLGASCDWDREAFTMSGAPGAPAGEEGNFHDAVIKVFVDLYNKGLIYRGKRLVNWDPHFETAISDLEVEQTEVDGHMWHFKYPLAGGETYIYREKDEDGNVTFEEERDYISIATTRPETMLGDGAVAVHPSDERYAAIVGKYCEIPVGPEEFRRHIPIITDIYPDPTFGSGAVKITGAHDFNDYGVAQRNGIPLFRLMDTRAQMRSDGLSYAESAALAHQILNGAKLSEAEIDRINLVPEELRGLDRYEARKIVISAVNGEGLAVTKLVKSIDPETNAEHLERVPVVENKKIMQPFGDRSKVVIEPMLTDQWFVETSKIVGPALDAVRNGETKILPERDAKVYFHWLENIEPWCISRQLWWGHQIPVWYGLDVFPTGFKDDQGDNALDEAELFAFLYEGGFNHADPIYHCAPSFEGVSDQFRDALAPLPMPLNQARLVEVADRAEAMDMLAASLAAYNLDQDPTKLVYPVWRDADVLDTWFSSGLWPIGTLGWPEQTPELARYFPSSVLVTGFDIIFFWVARMMMMQLAVVEDIPFKTVYVHALVRDEKGKKMSKSLGNVLDPLDLIADYGTDAVRFTLAAMAAMGRDLKLSKDRIAGYRNFGTKLWNACRFAEMNGVWEGHATQEEAPKATATANRWIIAETAKTLAEVNLALEEFRFDQAADALYKFVWGKVCDWYVEFAKPLFDGADADETRKVMAWVLDQSMILLHPFMPFITEELWATTGSRAKLLVHSDWPEYGADLADAEAEAEMGFVTGLIDEIRSARAQCHVPVGLKADLVATDLPDAARAAFARNEALIRRMARIEAFSEGAAPKGSMAIAVGGAGFAIPLEGLIDVAEEKARLKKTAEKLAKEIGGLKGRLDNPKFIASAPEDVVDEARGNLEAREDEKAKVEAALARLSELS
ncbi:valine--tRNA ligase [Pseudogemmobacter faecipullorum]|uniref:Valine--tRNA ligase n=1 Tax=Pseudogemmobacter faecipullorum TaxID=2755041 RepID=A0ABS8CIQ4_9RHOB|nr:valine--tRNA ligase [Pseudogemmobacter faecipullorum]MCB5409249.1 valine--tRNA ligase [Pseudogemmobacter faecipullorum]